MRFISHGTNVFVKKIRLVEATLVCAFGVAVVRKLLSLLKNVMEKGSGVRHVTNYRVFVDIDV